MQKTERNKRKEYKHIIFIILLWIKENFFNNWIFSVFCIMDSPRVFD